MSVLKAFVDALGGGEIEVADLASDLSEDSALLPLPPQWPNTPPFVLHNISRYDEREPAWYWNWFSTGEHTGTHFDASIHWVSGQDLEANSVDQIPARLFVGPTSVFDAVCESAADADFLVDVEFIKSWEQQYGQIPPKSWGPAQDGLVAPDIECGVS